MVEPSGRHLMLGEAMSNINRRILIIDDNAAIHEDFRKVLCGPVEAGNALELLETELLGETVVAVAPQFELDSAFQGEEGLDKLRDAQAEGRPYAMAFVDMRMPPGWDGLKTIEHLWKADPALQVVICSAHSDYEWSEVMSRLNHSDRLLVLRKPFEPIEVQQCASALCQKWQN